MTTPIAKSSVIVTDIFNTTLTLNFPLTTGTPELQIDVTTLPTELLHMAAAHGLKQKLCDAAAISRNTSNGASATPDDKYAAVKAIYDRLTGPNPTWNAPRAGVERTPGTLFVRAVAEVTGKTVAEMAPQIKAMTKDQQAALKQNPRVLAVIQRMEREAADAAATKAGNSDELLASLMGNTDDLTDGEDA